MGLKDLFIVSDENEKANEQKQDAVVPTTSTTKFPTSTPTSEDGGGLLSVFGFGKSDETTPQPTMPTAVSNEHLQATLELYQKGFDSINQPGYDFYEFYQAIMQAGPTNPQVYGMALTMASAMDRTITKDKLIQQSDYYLAEITKVYNDYNSKGIAKKQDLISQKQRENEALTNELSLLRQQLEAIKTQIADKENKLSVIDVKYAPMLSEVDSKIGANEMAKNQIVQSIEQVKNGIINNIK
jgi:hypothetical protein